MNKNESKDFSMFFLNDDTETGKAKLLAIRQNLYEATTKVVLYSIEMYTQTKLQHWVKAGLQENKKHWNNDLRKASVKLDQGQIDAFDITTGCYVINNFVRDQANTSANKLFSAKLQATQSALKELEEKKMLIKKRRTLLENSASDIKKSIPEDDASFSLDNHMPSYKNTDNLSEEEDAEDFEDDDKETNLSAFELFQKELANTNNLIAIGEMEEELDNAKTQVENDFKELKRLTSTGLNFISEQSKKEKTALENLRTLRNTVFAHKTEDEQEISKIGGWTPKAGPMYNWASEILQYLKIIDERYRYYALFDDFYASKEEKAQFDSCKVYVQRQIKELYVNKSNTSFEFAGVLYDKKDDEYNFEKLIESMAISWDTGIRYLTIVTNEDLPELNIFFKECLSGTNKYVDIYLVDRNALREAYSENNNKETDYLYFKLLYHLNPSMENIYWKNKFYTTKDFAKQVLYKIIKSKSMFILDRRLKNPDSYSDGLDIIEWCEHHILSAVFFAAKEDSKGQKLALEMENSVMNFIRHDNDKGRSPFYKRAIKALVRLFFYMGDDYVFSYARDDGSTLRWRSLDDARRYFEDSRKFKSLEELSGWVNEMYKSDYFKTWKKQQQSL